MRVPGHHRSGPHEDVQVVPIAYAHRPGCGSAGHGRSRLRTGLVRARHVDRADDVLSGDSAQIVGVRLRVGQDLLGDPVPRDPALINQFVVEDAAGRKPLVGRDGADPAGFLRVAAPGLLVIGYRSNPSASS